MIRIILMQTSRLFVEMTRFSCFHSMRLIYWLVMLTCVGLAASAATKCQKCNDFGGNPKCDMAEVEDCTGTPPFSCWSIYDKGSDKKKSGGCGGQEPNGCKDHTEGELCNCDDKDECNEKKPEDANSKKTSSGGGESLVKPVPWIRLLWVGLGLATPLLLLSFKEM